MKLAEDWTSGWAPPSGRTGFALVLVLCALWVIAVAWALASGPGRLAAAEQQRAAELEQENQEVCQRLGMPLGSERYAACASELAGVRQHDEDRLTRRSLGFI